MDFQKFVDKFSAMTCIISVEKSKDPASRYGKIRIVTGNSAYINSIERSHSDSDLPDTLSNSFIPNSEYKRYIPEDLNFEDVCYRCAVLKEPIHNYVHPERYNVWFNVFLMPIESEDEDLAYCTYTQQFMEKADSDKLTDAISKESAGDILNACIKLKQENEFEVAIQNVINDIRAICKASRCVVLLMDEVNRSCSVLCEALDVNSDLLPVEELLGDEFYSIAETFEDTIDGSYGLAIQNKEDMEYVRKRNPIWYESLSAAGVETMFIYPVKTRNELLGYIWATDFDTKYTKRIKDTLELTTFFIASEIANNRMFQRLRTLSSIDMLTGVLNRNEMNNCITEICDKMPPHKGDYGIIFVDMNGLKIVNDTQGHEAGDMLLRNAATILKFAFPNEKIYRAGGDEFMILCGGLTVDEMKERISIIKEQSENYENVSFSAGFGFAEHSNLIRKSLRDADTMMYADKEEYYKLHPDKRR